MLLSLDEDDAGAAVRVVDIGIGVVYSGAVFVPRAYYDEDEDD